MANLSATGAGLSSDPGLPSDLEAIYQGGQYFLDRMKAMDAQRALAAKALSDLAIGQDIASAQRGVQQALVDAQAKLAEADKILADANVRASSIMNGARSIAKQTTDAANDSASQANDAAAKVRKDADDYAKDIKSQADAALSAANQHLSEMAAKTAAA